MATSSTRSSGARADRRDHRPPPARVLEEAQRRAELVVAARQLLEQLAARAACVRNAGRRLPPRRTLSASSISANASRYRSSQPISGASSPLNVVRMRSLDRSFASGSITTRRSPRTRPGRCPFSPSPLQANSRGGSETTTRALNRSTMPPRRCIAICRSSSGLSGALDREHERIPLRICGEVGAAPPRPARAAHQLRPPRRWFSSAHLPRAARAPAGSTDRAGFLTPLRAAVLAGAERR